MNDDHIDHFSARVDRLPEAFADEMPLGNTVGLDSSNDRVCSCLAEYKVRQLEYTEQGVLGKQHY